MSIKEQLAKIVGDRFVADGSGELYVYSFDMTENPPQRPSCVVMPESVDEVVQIVKLANVTKTPLVPFVTGQNVGGLTIPQVEGAVIVDLKRIDQIVEVDEDAMYAVVEPGVTFGHLRKYLDEYHPTLRYTYPLAPPYTSVLANTLLQGLCDLSTRYGSMADFVNGLEAVLPTGELVRVGSGAMGDGNWFGRYPLPDLVGLFSGWQGMTGIVTKVAVKLWPNKPHVKHSTVLSFGEEPTIDLVAKIARAGLVDEAFILSTSILKMILHAPYPVKYFQGEPDYATLLVISGNSEGEVREKYKVVEAFVNQVREIDPRNQLVPFEVLAKLVGNQAFDWVDFPSDVFRILTEFDGLTWMGTYIHPKNWAEALTKGRKIVESYGFELQAFLKAMDMMHYGEFKFIIRFPKDEDTIERVKSCNEELLDLVLSLKAIPYKTPVWAAKKLHEHIDPEFVELVKRIKKALDPNNIMNPGRWGL